MTTLALERFVGLNRSAAAPRVRAGVTGRIAVVRAAIRAAQELDNAVSPTAQVGAVRRFASSIAA